MAEKIKKFKQSIEELFNNYEKQKELLDKLLEAIEVKEYMKKNSELKEVTVISYRVKGDRFRSHILTNDNQEINKFYRIMTSFTSYKKREYLDLKIRKITFISEGKYEAKSI